MKKLLIANFKQNKTKNELEQYFKNLSIDGNDSCKVVIAPSLVHLDFVKGVISENIKIAGQTVSPFPKGTYTGAVGAFQLKDLGVEYCIVGHSERRKYFGESVVVVNNQIRELETVGITPIICFSNLSEVRQLEVENKDYYLAYEPIDAIITEGSDAQAYENKDIEDMFLKVTEILGETRLIYGGSVGEDNIDRLCDISGVNGFLVGSASLDVQRFSEIYRKVK